jgi:dTDP-L-rhamnose 4-epimerase
MVKRALVTGGAGFIGSHVVDELLDGGANVIVVDSLDPTAHADAPNYLDPRADLRLVALDDEDALADAVADIDVVCHQAARVGLGVDLDDITRYVHDNDAGTATLLRALWRRRFTGRIVVASSMVVYGEGRYTCPEHGDVRPGPREVAALMRREFEPTCPSCDTPVRWAPITEDAPLDPRNVYAATKLHTEHLAFIYGRETGAPVCALRYHNVYGPRMPRDTPYAGVASIFRSALESGAPPLVFEDGAQTRDFVHVRDVAHANVLALASSWTGALNVASGHPHTILDLADTLAAAHGPDALAPVVTGRYRLGDVRHVVASPRRAAEVLGFVAETGFAAGVTAFATDPLRDAVTHHAAPAHR